MRLLKSWVNGLGVGREVANRLSGTGSSHSRSAAALANPVSVSSPRLSTFSLSQRWTETRFPPSWS